MNEAPEAADLLLLHAQQTTENAVLLLDRSGTIHWCNAAATRVFGYAAADLTGMDLERLFVPEDVRQGVPAYELQVAAQSSDMHNDRWMMRADGVRFWAAGTVTALRAADGTLLGFAKLLRDASDVKEQLETLRNRAAELAQADEHKNLFLSTLSHELRNPLAPLANALALIRLSRPLEPALQYPIKLIERQVDFIRRLVNDLLDVTRISSGRLDLALAPVDLREVIARAVETARPLITERRHQLVEHILDAPIVACVDAGRIEQVFINLLTNAARYTPDRGTIEIRATADESEVWVRFIDSGIGIAPEMLPHIFDLFTRGDAASGQSKEGLGIGLSLVKRFVELHGGTVQVRSEGPGKGSEFTVRLRRAGPAEQTSV
jgi:PAS domain S-box-containing protein